MKTNKIYWNVLLMSIIITLAVTCDNAARPETEEIAKEEDTVVEDAGLAIQIDTLRHHNSFDAFWKDFKVAVLSNNPDRVRVMIDFPFEDSEGSEHVRVAEETSEAPMYPNLTMENRQDFDEKYDSVFNRYVTLAVANGLVIDYKTFVRSYPSEEVEFIFEDEYLLSVDPFIPCEEDWEEGMPPIRGYNLIFSKDNLAGVYRLDRIQQSP